MTAKKVLVLCQRKEGKCNEGLVQDLVSPHFQRYLREELKSVNHTIEYLAHINDNNMEVGDKVDFNLKLDANNAKFEAFLKTHKKSYSVIIANTCPFVLIDFKCVFDLLDDSGVVILSQVRCCDPYSKDMFVISPAYLETGTANKCNITDFFQYNEKKRYYKKLSILVPPRRRKGSPVKKRSPKKKRVSECPSYKNSDDCRKNEICSWNSKTNKCRKTRVNKQTNNKTRASKKGKKYPITFTFTVLGGKKEDAGDEWKVFPANKLTDEAKEIFREEVLNQLKMIPGISSDKIAVTFKKTGVVVKTKIEFDIGSKTSEETEEVIGYIDILNQKSIWQTVFKNGKHNVESNGHFCKFGDIVVSR
jgi:hypothetical protein